MEEFVNNNLFWWNSDYESGGWPDFAFTLFSIKI